MTVKRFLSVIIAAVMVGVGCAAPSHPTTWQKTPHALSEFGIPIVECANLTKDVDIKYPSHYDPKAEAWVEPRNALFRAITETMAQFGVQFHLEWGQLLGWYRDCTWNWRDHDLDIAMFASDWSPELDLALLRVWHEHRCSTGWASNRWIKHDKYKLKTPIQTLYHCKEHSTGWEYLDLAFVHRRSVASATPAVNQQGHVDPDQPNNVWWWVGNNGGYHHFRHKPYNMVPANILGIPGWVPENVEEHIAETYGPTWHSIDENSTKVNSQNERGGSPALKDTSFDDEWWAEVPDRHNSSRIHLVRASLLQYQGLEGASRHGHYSRHHKGKHHEH